MRSLESGDNARVKPQSRRSISLELVFASSVVRCRKYAGKTGNKTRLRTESRVLADRDRLEILPSRVPIVRREFPGQGAHQAQAHYFLSRAVH
jgi:hypothetical protein